MNTNRSFSNPMLRLGSLVCCLALLGGCSNSSINEIEDLETVSLYSQTDQLAQTMEYIRSLDRYETRNFRDKVNSGLNRWATSSDVDMAPSWKLPELATGLPEVIRNANVFTNLDDTTFFSNDADYLQQIYWMKQIAERVAPSNFVFHQEYLYQMARQMADQETLDRWKEESEDLLFDGLKLIHDEMVDGQDDSRVLKLAQAIKLFDWTVRHVHLKETRDWPTEDVVRNEAMDINAAPDSFPAAAGAAGPGYVRFPWQALTYAKGDYLERAKVFAGLCNQVEIPVAVLATPVKDAETTRPYQEWLCGVLIGEELYLFDTLLGLPIHGKRPGSIATLSEVKANPELLTDLNLTPEESIEKMDYRVTSDQLDQLMALIVAPPESLSRRMAATEASLTGDIRLNLTMDVDAIAEQFRKATGISNVQLWHAPFSTSLFREQVAFAQAASFDQEVRSRLRWLMTEERYIDMFVQLRTARNCFLQGVFRSDKDRDVRSALSYYYSFMYDDEEIAFIERDELKQRSLGILRDLNQSYSEWKAQLEYMKQSMGLVRADAAFFLSMCNYENNMPSTALKWLIRIRNYDDDQRWSEYLPYHVGRSHESTGNYKAAAESYAKDTSAQKHGSIIRQRLMKQLMDGGATGSGG